MERLTLPYPIRRFNGNRLIPISTLIIIVLVMEAHSLAAPLYKAGILVIEVKDEAEVGIIIPIVEIIVSSVTGAMILKINVIPGV
jgi:hypothetical protein